MIDSLDEFIHSSQNGSNVEDLALYPEPSQNEKPKESGVKKGHKRHSLFTCYLISLALAMLSPPVCEKSNLQKLQQKTFLLKVNLDMMDRKGAKFLKILQEKNVKFYFFSLKTK